MRLKLFAVKSCSPRIPYVVRLNYIATRREAIKVALFCFLLSLDGLFFVYMVLCVPK